MAVTIFSGRLVDSNPDWSLRVEEGVLVVQGDRIVERAPSQELHNLADRLDSRPEAHDVPKPVLFCHKEKLKAPRVFHCDLQA